MPCIQPPQPQIEATITVGPAPDYPLAFVPNPNDGSAKYIDRDGNLDFSSFSCEITIRFTIATRGIVFYKGYGRDSISYAESLDPAELKQPVADGHHQFRKGLNHPDPQTLVFEYHNDCGRHGDRACPSSRYGLYLGYSGGFLKHHDPIINNGGTQNFGPK
jgi:hypothetical protein